MMHNGWAMPVDRALLNVDDRPRLVRRVVDPVDAYFLEAARSDTLVRLRRATRLWGTRRLTGARDDRSGPLFPIVLALFVLLLSGTSTARGGEPDLRPELDPRGGLAAWALTPAGDLWLGTRAGYAYTSRDGNWSWEEVEVSERRIGPGEFFGDSLTEVRFFDERRGFFAGWIGEHQNVIWRTSDGGKTWVESRLPQQTFWVYDAQVTADGIAWLVGSSGDLVYSEDYGRSWRPLTRPFESQSTRSNTVHFLGDGLGVVGALSDGLALTRDGG